MITISDLRKYELADLKIFEKFVTPHYTPSPKPIAMCVGASSINEGRILKAFHGSKFGLDLKVAACNTLPFERRDPKSYDFEIYDQVLGDAKMSFPYDFATAEMNLEPRGFDMIYIRNPALVEMDYDQFIFERALLHVAPKTGVVVTLIRQGDVEKYLDLLSRLSYNKITPVFSGKTGIKLDCPGLEDFTYTIGIFKSNK